MRIPSTYRPPCQDQRKVSRLSSRHPSLLSARSVQLQMFELVENFLKHKSDMVNIEAARVMCNMKGVTNQQLARPVQGASPLSSSPTCCSTPPNPFQLCANLAWCRASSISPLGSPPALHVLEPIDPQVCRHSDPQQARPDPPFCCRRLQHRARGDDHRAEPIDGYHGHHHSPQGSSSLSFRSSSLPPS
jgi:hypothetical protein